MQCLRRFSEELDLRHQKQKSGKCSQHALLIYSKLSNTSYIIGYSEWSWFISSPVINGFFWIKMKYSTDQGEALSIDKIRNWCRSLLFDKSINCILIKLLYRLWNKLIIYVWLTCLIFWYVYIGPDIFYNRGVHRI